MAKKTKSKRVTRTKLLASIWRQLEELDAQMTGALVEELTTDELQFVEMHLAEVLNQTSAYFMRIVSEIRRQLVKPVKRKQAARRRG